MIQLKTCFFLFLSLTILASCKEDDDKPDKPNYGIQYFECKINGEFFQAISIPFQCSGPRFDYYPEPFMSVPEGYMLLAGKDCVNSSSCGIRIFGYDGKEGWLDFLEPMTADSIFPYHRSYPSDSLESVLYDQLVDGHVFIEQLLPRVSGSSPFGTIKGTFEYTVTDELGIDTICITEGSFRFDVPQIF